MQFVPSTWADMQSEVGVTDPLDPEQSIKAAAYYLDKIRKYVAESGKFGSKSMLAGCNWGMGHVATKGWEMAPPETLRFIDLVLEMSEAFGRWEDGW